jgi:Pentapeptide repeats (8 copies)
MKKVKGWKCLGNDMSCRGFKFRIGESYHQDGEIKLCENGFHFHENSLDIYKYSSRENSIVTEIEASGVVTGQDKSVCSDITIIRILSGDEIKKICNLVDNVGLHNSGHQNSGNWNSGNRNSGNQNSGDQNSGNWNSGNQNSGNWNSGNWNSGDQNSGNRNSGNWNSGNRNSGNRNSGNWNSGNRNSGNRNSGNWNACSNQNGFFNTQKPKSLMVFNKSCSIKRWESVKKPRFLYFPLTEWVPEGEMSEQDKIDHPEFYCQKGYLKTLGYKEAFQKSWGNRGPEEQKELEALPNFSWHIFTQISGIKKPLEEKQMVQLNDSRIG